MKNRKYALTADAEFTVFTFTSKGPRGVIPKLIQFQITDQPDLYNLAFGDNSAETGRIDDHAISNNNDSGKVLATIVAAIYLFFHKHPHSYVYAAGSSPARMRLYRMVINRFFKEISTDFELYGQVGNNFYPFEKGKDYQSFLVQRKFNKLH